MGPPARQTATRAPGSPPRWSLEARERRERVGFDSVPALISHKGRRPPAGRTLPFRAGRSMRRRSVTRAVRRGKRKPRSRSGAIRQLVLGEGMCASAVLSPNARRAGRFRLRQRGTARVDPPPMPDRYPDQYGSLGPHVYSGQAPTDFRARSRSVRRAVAWLLSATAG